MRLLLVSLIDKSSSSFLLLEKLEVEQYLKTKFQGSMIGTMLDYVQTISK